MSKYSFTEDWFSHNISRFERHLQHLKDTPCHLLEIGSHEGRSAIWLLENIATQHESGLICIEPNINTSLRENIKATGSSDRVTFFNDKSHTALCRLPIDYFDFIYVDGSHSTINVIEDAVLSFRLAKVGGVIAFDDYLWDKQEWDHPKPAIDAFLKIYYDKIEVLEIGYQVWLKKKSD